ncbi:MAG TPA: hypothetical protein VMH01_14675 [Puia sp.]|nr:hypothetical protein [Puia sp.]
MKILFSIAFAILSTGILFAQGHESSFVYLNHIPTQDFPLDKGWKFHPGDDTSWARSSFDDSQWQTVDLSDYTHYLPAFSSKKIGWFRTKIIIDSQISTNQFVVTLSQLGASELYINGNSLLTLGQIDGTGKYKSDNPHNKPFLLPSNLVDTVSIAIRFASNTPSRIWQFTNAKVPPLFIKIGTLNPALRSFELDLQQQRIPFGFSFLSIGIGILFLLIYFFSPEEKIHLLFGTFCLFGSMLPVIQFQLAENNLDMTAYGIFFSLIGMINKVCSLLLLSIVSLITFKRMYIHQVILIGYILVIDSLLQLLFPPTTFIQILGLASRILLAVELCRIGIYAFLKMNFIIGAVSLFSAFMNFIFLPGYITHKDYSSFYNQFHFITCLILIGIYLISQISPNNRSKKLPSFSPPGNQKVKPKN